MSAADLTAGSSIAFILHHFGALQVLDLGATKGLGDPPPLTVTHGADGREGLSGEWEGAAGGRGGKLLPNLKQLCLSFW